MLLEPRPPIKDPSVVVQAQEVHDCRPRGLEPVVADAERWVWLWGGPTTEVILDPVPVDSGLDEALKTLERVGVGAFPPGRMALHPPEVPDLEAPTEHGDHGVTRVREQVDRTEVDRRLIGSGRLPSVLIHTPIQLL